MTETPPDRRKTDREARLQRALRDNLMRRKQQARARRAGEGGSELDEARSSAGQNDATSSEGRRVADHENPTE